MKHPILRGGALALALVAACHQPQKQSATPKDDVGAEDITPPVAQPWTDAFTKKAVLFADVIEIEGPAGMIKHAGVRIEPDIHDAHLRTTPKGLLQEVSLKPGAGAEVRAILDNWELVAFQRITILERVGPGDVELRARGQARFVDQTSGQEQNGETLQFEGKIPR